MPRASRHYLPGHVWHITHRCHKQEFLLKFSKDRKRWLYWLFQAKKRYGLCVLNYIVTSNHIHLLVLDTQKNCIANSMQLIAGRTAQEYNARKNRKGAFWEDRYFATAISTDQYLSECISYIDLNMLRAGVIKHPSEWVESGYNEIQKPGKRYKIINREILMSLLNISNETSLKQQHKLWIDEKIKANNYDYNEIWSSSLAIGNQDFIDKVYSNLGISTYTRKKRHNGDQHYIKEPTKPYSIHFDMEKLALS